MNDQAIQVAGNAGVSAQSFGFVINKNENDNTLTIDDFEITGFASGPAQLNLSTSSIDFTLLHLSRQRMNHLMYLTLQAEVEMGLILKKLLLIIHLIHLLSQFNQQLFR